MSEIRLANIVTSLVLTSYLGYVIGAAVINTVCGGCLVE